MASRPQATISSYFTPNTSPSTPKKRAVSHIDLTNDDPDNNRNTPVAKKHKTSLRSISMDEYHSLSSTHSPQKAAKYHVPLDETARKNRREAFKRKLLAENNSIFRRNSVDMDAEPMDVEEEDRDDARTMEEEDVSGHDSDEAFKNLSTIFSHKKSKEKTPVKGKGKARMTNDPKKRQEDVPASGQPYTPLEKQVASSPLELSLPSSFNEHRC